MNIPTYDDVLAAHERIQPHIHRTPVLTSSYFNARTRAELFFKCENYQKAGAFKVRGASNAVFGSYLFAIVLEIHDQRVGIKSMEQAIKES